MRDNNGPFSNVPVGWYLCGGMICPPGWKPNRKKDSKNI